MNVLSRSLAFAAFLFVPLLGACVSQAEYQSLRESKKEKVNQLRKAITDLEQDNKDLRDRVNRLKTENERLRAAKDIAEETSRISRAMEGVIEQYESLRRADSGAIEISGDVLFAPGRAQIQEQAKKPLNDIVDVLKQRQEKIQIVGHTDNTPIKQSADRWTTETNMELGAYRALNVFLYLRNNGIDADRMHICSFGEYNPRVPNNSPANKKKNRRVEIFLQRGGSGGSGKGSGAPEKGEGPPQKGEEDTPQKGNGDRTPPPQKGE